MELFLTVVFSHQTPPLRRKQLLETLPHPFFPDESEVDAFYIQAHIENRSEIRPLMDHYASLQPDVLRVSYSCALSELKT